MVTKVLYTKIYRVLRTYGRVEKNAPQPSVLWGGYTVRKAAGFEHVRSSWVVKSTSS